MGISTRETGDQIRLPEITESLLEAGSQDITTVAAKGQGPNTVLKGQKSSSHVIEEAAGRVGQPSPHFTPCLSL